jgi:predicted ATP-dependent serine protease
MSGSTLSTVIHGQRVLSLAQYREQRGDITEPEALAYGLAYPGRVTLLSAKEKLGKSTLVSAMLSAISQGREWLGHPTTQAPVLIVELEEHPDDLVLKLARFDADGRRLQMLFDLPVEGRDQALFEAVSKVEPSVVVIDSLSAFVEHEKPSSGDASAWTAAVRPFVKLARDFNCAVILIHHDTKNGHGYRDSNAIGAVVDLVVHMENSAKARRKVTSKGRWNVPDFEVELVGDRYELVGGPVDLRGAILRFVERNEGSSKNTIIEAVVGSRTTVIEQIDKMVDAGELRRVPEGSTQKHYLPEQNHPENHPHDRFHSTGGVTGSPHRTATEPVQNQFRNHSTNGEVVPTAPPIRVGEEDHPTSPIAATPPAEGTEASSANGRGSS